MRVARVLGEGEAFYHDNRTIGISPLKSKLNIDQSEACLGVFVDLCGVQA